MTLHEKEYPTYKIHNNGTGSMSDIDLLAVLIAGNPDIALQKARAIMQGGNTLTKLCSANARELTKHVSPKEAGRIIAAFEIYRRKQAESGMETIKAITSAKDAYDIISPNLIDLDHEEFWVLPLSRANKPLGLKRLSTGGSCGTVAETRMVIKELLDFKAAAFIIAHNHPSGSTESSSADRELTKRMKDAGAIFELPLLDHIIVGKGGGYLSFAEDGLI